MARVKSGLSPRQLRFVAEYVATLNATQSAIAAGYSAKTATTQGPRLLENVGIQAAIQEAKVKLQIRTEITQDRVLKELALLAFSDHTHYEVDDLGKIALAPHAPEGAHRAIASVKRRVTTDSEGGVTREVELKFWDKPGPLRLAGRHVGLFVDDRPDQLPPTEIHIHGEMKPPPGREAPAQDTTLPNHAHEPKARPSDP